AALGAPAGARRHRLAAKSGDGRQQVGEAALDAARSHRLVQRAAADAPAVRAGEGEAAAARIEPAALRLAQPETFARLRHELVGAAVAGKQSQVVRARRRQAMAAVAPPRARL